MKNIYFTIVLLFTSCCCCAQNNKIKELVYEMKTFSKTDTAYYKILNLKTNAIPELINLLNDTDVTIVMDDCFHVRYKTGDLAFLLIDVIEQIPYFVVTHRQYDSFDPRKYCNISEEILCNVVRSDRQTFQQQYSKYFYGVERKKILKYRYKK